MMFVQLVCSTCSRKPHRWAAPFFHDARSAIGRIWNWNLVALPCDDFEFLRGNRHGWHGWHGWSHGILGFFGPNESADPAEGHQFHRFQPIKPQLCHCPAPLEKPRELWQSLWFGDLFWWTVHSHVSLARRLAMVALVRKRRWWCFPGDTKTTC